MMTRSMTKQVQSVVEDLVNKVATSKRVSWHLAGITQVIHFDIGSKPFKRTPVGSIRRKLGPQVAPFKIPANEHSMKPIPIVRGYPIMVDPQLIGCQLPFAQPKALSEVWDIAKQQPILDYEQFYKDTEPEMHHGLELVLDEYVFDNPLMQELYG